LFNPAAFDMGAAVQGPWPEHADTASAGESLSQIASSRLATAEDEGFLFRLFAEGRMAELAQWGIPSSQAEQLTQLQYRGQRITYLQRYPRAENLILLSECGTPAGRMLLDRQPDRWRIIDIAVLTEFRHRGVATRAIRDCQFRCRASGSRLELQVDPANPARMLYERLGFRVAAEVGASLEMIWRPGPESE
jgi:ribosomal protein S18 acetylase RimI-like enzyme